MTEPVSDNDVKVSIARGTRRWPYERRMLAWTLLLTAPGLLLAAVTMLAVGAPLSVWVFGWLPAAGLCVLLAVVVRNKAGYPLRTLANLVESIRSEDYSLKGVTGPPPGALHELISEINALSDDLRARRFSGVEAELLIAKIVEELDAAVLAFDDDMDLSMVNPSGCALFAASPGDLLGRSAESLGVLALLELHQPQVEQHTFPGRQGRFRIQASTYRQSGKPQHLLVLTDLSLTLRQEERLAWQRLIRVIGHELNNSLAPIRSMAESLASLLERDPRPDDWDVDARAGLAVIKDRAQALSSFMSRYAELARLPPPSKQPMNLRDLLGRVAALESGWSVQLDDCPDLSIEADAAQLEQLLINLVKNAGEANQATSSDAPVVVSWRPTLGGGVEIKVTDSGRGIPESDNLFTPFFTTKAGGSGVGLLLGRQIAEAHGGHLSLANRTDGARGCVARVTLPA
ncbi:MAG: ATP-binding protein [Xanthomonadales bacterium]|nr:ATP-binding protein [Xanthomonadales bacterium]